MTEREELVHRIEHLSEAKLTDLNLDLLVLQGEPMPYKASKKVGAAQRAVSRAIFYLQEAAEILKESK